MKSTQARTSFRHGLAAVAASFALFAGAAVAQEPIKIGAFLAVTGPAASLGDPEQKTLELYVERLNAGDPFTQPGGETRLPPDHSAPL